MASDSLREILVVSLIVSSAVPGYLAWAYRRSSVKWKARSQHWFSVSMGEKPMFDEAAAMKLRAELFPGGRIVKAPVVPVSEIFRPLGATAPVSFDVRSREWREYRALRGIDHHRLHFAEGQLASEWATEVLQATVGGYERDV